MGAYWLRRRKYIAATFCLCVFFPATMIIGYIAAEGVDGMGALAVVFFASVMFGPATLAAWIGAWLGWRRARRRKDFRRK